MQDIPQDSPKTYSIGRYLSVHKPDGWNQVRNGLDMQYFTDFKLSRIGDTIDGLFISIDHLIEVRLYIGYIHYATIPGNHIYSLNNELDFFEKSFPQVSNQFTSIIIRAVTSIDCSKHAKLYVLYNNLSYEERRKVAKNDQINHLKHAHVDDGTLLISQGMCQGTLEPRVITFIPTFTTNNEHYTWTIPVGVGILQDITVTNVPKTVIELWSTSQCIGRLHYNPIDGGNTLPLLDSDGQPYHINTRDIPYENLTLRIASQYLVPQVELKYQRACRSEHPYGVSLRVYGKESHEYAILPVTISGGMISITW